LLKTKVEPDDVNEKTEAFEAAESKKLQGAVRAKILLLAESWEWNGMHNRHTNGCDAYTHSHTQKHPKNTLSPAQGRREPQKCA
jgi:hypothetical protein